MVQQGDRVILLSRNIGLGVGGGATSQVLEDFESFTTSIYGGSTGDFTTTQDSTQGEWGGELPRAGGDDRGIHTLDTTLRRPVTLRCWVKILDEAGSASVSFFSQAERDIPETYNVSMEASDEEFELNYQNGTEGSWSGDTSGGALDGSLTSFAFTLDHWYEIEIRLPNDGETMEVDLYDGSVKEGTLLASITAADDRLQSGGYGFGNGGPESTARFDNYRII
jgi:hypothetical protein